MGLHQFIHRRNRVIAPFASGAYPLTTTTSRSTDLWLPDHEGVLHQFSANEEGIVNGRLSGGNWLATDAAGDLLSPAPSVWCQPAATNLVTYSHEFDNGIWLTIRASITANNTAAPDGASTADKLVEDGTASNTHAVALQNWVVSAATNYVFSFYVKAGERTWVAGDLWNTAAPTDDAWEVNLSTGAVNSSGANIDVATKSIGNGWWRIRLSFTTGAGTALNVGVYLHNGTSSIYSGDGSSGLYIWGAQLEQSTYATSYIPTSGATVTANATEPLVAWPSGLVNDFVAKFDWTNDTAITGAKLLDFGAASANQSVVYITGAEVRFRKRLSSTNYDADFTLTPVDNTTYEVRVHASSVGGMAVYVDGVKGGTAHANVSDLVVGSSLALGHNLLTSEEILGSIGSVKIYKVSPKITDAQVIGLS